MGVARAAVEAQAVLSEQAAALAAIRAAAIQHELETRSLVDLAHELGVSKQAIFRASRAADRQVAAW